MMEEMCAGWELALDGVDDGERCISLDTWHVDACIASNIPRVRVHTCEVAFVSRCGHKCGETRVD